MAHDPTPLRALLAATLSNTLAVVPLFLLGALAVFIRADLAFGETQLGLAAASFSGTSALLSVPGGRIGERIGPQRALGSAAVATAAALLGIAVLARSWLLLCGFLALAGAGNALAQPSTNALLSRRVPQGRQGVAFGIKQASVPLAGLIAGLAVPLLGLTLGWRWAFAAGGLAALLFSRVMPAIGPAERIRRQRVREGDVAAGPLVLLAAAASVGAAAANALGAFYVESAVAHGLSPGPAGLALAGGSASGIAARVAWGWLADRRDGRHLPVVALLLTVGAGGFVLLAGGHTGLPLAIGTLLAFAAGWGWPGLFNFAVVRHNRNAPAAATGITQSGIFLGAFVGPPLFGALVEATSYRTAWLAAGTAVIAAAGMVLVGRKALLGDLQRRGALPG